MADPGWWTLPVPFLVINDVIMASLLLLEVIYLLPNFLILINTLLLKYFSLNVFFEGNRFKKWRHNDVTLRHCVNQIIPRSWK